MSQLPLLISDTTHSELALPLSFLDKLETRQDYEAAFANMSQYKNNAIWYEADLILSYYKKFVGQHLDIYRAGQLMNDSTIRYYLRTASGFPPENRIPNISFNHHYAATFSDQWNSKNLQFEGDKRFGYAERAADEGMSTRKLREVLRQDEEKETTREGVIGCIHCIKGGELETLSLYRSSAPRKPLKLFLHPSCIQEVLNFTIQTHDTEPI